MNCTDDWLAAQVLERFLRYVAVETTSDRRVRSSPSTEGQWTLLRMLETELRGMGLSDVELDSNGFLIARVPANREGIPTIGFMAHVDTTSEVGGRDVSPVVHEEYDGAPIVVADNLILDPEAHPALKRYVGSTVITTDGTTLLGADDKAGVAEIMTLVSCLLSDRAIPHGAIEVIFTPDEETGHGMDRFPLERIKSEVCYTLDGSEEGVIEIECFHAVRVEVECTGVSIHTGTARGKLVNAISMLTTFLGMIPQSESPEATDERYGFYVATEMNGTIESATCTMLLRDFDAEGIERRANATKTIASAVEAAYPGGRITIREEEQYRNMRRHFDERSEVVLHLEEAIRMTGIEPERRLIRGGTDGSRLSEMGVPTPNVFTGGHNYHSRLEWAALPAMVRAIRTISNLCTLWAKM